MIDAKKIYIATTTLPKIFGGRTKSLLNYSKLLQENGIPTVILTTNFNSNYNERYKQFLDEKKSHPNQEYLNIYDWFREQENKEINYSIENYKEYLDENKNIYNNEKLEIVNKENVLDVLLNKKLKERIFLDKDKNIYKINYVHDEKIYLEKYFLSSGKCFLEARIKYNAKQKELRHSMELNYKNKMFYFYTEKIFFTFWFNKIFVDTSKIINNVRVLDYSFISMNNNARVYHLVHGNHLKDGKNIDDIKKSFQYLFKKIDANRDKIITLTYDQKVDILKVYPRLKNSIEVIGHSFRKKEDLNFDDENRKNFVVISRLSEYEKNITDTLKAFKLYNLFSFRKEKLLIYGNGISEKILKKTSKDLKLGKYVEFKGRTDSPDIVFRKSKASLITSNAEGFSLSCKESLSNGCPVISYNVKYGPKDMIKNTGGLISKKNTPFSLFLAMKKFKSKKYNSNELVNSIDFLEEKNIINKWKEILQYN